jgi:acetyltransferase-like isoleucine patch superfamily enzyme
MLRAIRAVVSALANRCHILADPAGYARSLGVRVGQNVRFYAMVPGMFSTEPWLISIGDNVHVTAGVKFVTHDGGTLILRREVPDLEWTAPIVISDDVYVGTNTIILPGVIIGRRCLIGAGSVVTRSIPDNSVAAGVPARVIKTTDQYLEAPKAKSLHCRHLHGAAKDAVLKQLLTPDAVSL